MMPLPASLSRLDTREIPDAPDEIRLFVRLLDEELRLEFFLEWYRKLGVNRFFFVDNGSQDASLKILGQQNDCHVFHTKDNMRLTRSGMDWIEPLLHNYGTGHWCIVVDADELLVYPDYETRKLPELCHQLEADNVNAYHCIMLDMYPAAEKDSQAYKGGLSFLDYSPYFDRAGYNYIPSYEGNHTIRGGPRVRLFYPDILDRSFTAKLRRRILTELAEAPLLNQIEFFKNLAPKTGPILNKVPLVKWNSDMEYMAGGHYLKKAKLSQTRSGALLHFKFLGDFADKAKKIANSDTYYQGGVEYKAYLHKLNTQGSLPLICDLSVKYEGSKQLAGLGLIRP